MFDLVLSRLFIAKCCWVS